MLEALLKRTQTGEKIAMLTCYDATFAKLMALAGVDVLLVGDSLGMVIQGDGNTLHVSMQDMVYHTRCVSNGARPRADNPSGTNSVIMSDMPAGSYEHDKALALANAQALIEAGAHIVKIEGGGNMVDTAAYLIMHGVPVCAHLGFTPQSVEKLGGYKIQGKTAESAHTMLADAQAMAHAGVSMVLFEMVPAALAAHITQQIAVPTIGIGAGAGCSGQVLVLQDLLGIYTGPADKAPEDYKAPRFAQNFLHQTGSVQQAIATYVSAVKAGCFPEEQHSY
ncbi:3-methyl-2-oxobutanoate hydroxymethyltransferase [Methylophilus aquaticus]|uniref:3-methyl-2-oxobutanoate hydroxymethyltransferase n=1 Tax=Methylophilus aquaticus TaxID=1971610 RepID=A0ABT9JQE3_9PROT|nr:3-methyl-2-oxobutanoate hydroxymethyltransferase [Methylophilus aquaticus]MDP8566773.1 3-methyl-2-oxobutanoate hydroxymethyltransferase [Methylophilus aquaticus]